MPLIRNRHRSYRRPTFQCRLEILEPRALLTALAPGDLAFTGYQATTPDKISFVLLKQVDSGTVVTLTDNAWNGSSLTTNEGTSVITFGATFGAGTQLNFDATRAVGSRWLVGASNGGLAETTSANFGLNAAGDNLFAYSGTAAPTSGTDGNWLAALATNAFVAAGGSISTSVTQLPGIFTLGDTAFSLGLANGVANENGAMITPASVSGTAGQVRAVINTLANWQTFTTAGGQAIPPAINFTLSTAAPTTIRAVSYNILSSEQAPRSGLDTILQAISAETVAGISKRIDLLFLQEVVASSMATVASLLNTAYSTTTYATGTLAGASTGSGTQGVVYDSQVMTLIGEKVIGTASSSGQPRQTVRHQLRPVGTNGTSDLYVYNGHWKATNDAPSAARRQVEAQAIRADADALGQGAHILYVGDFNAYSSNEAAFQTLLATGNAQGLDPVNRLGDWSGTSSFRDVFTQAPANVPPAGFTGGGLDDRFDFLVMSGEFFNGSGLEYRAGSYHTFGNNGSVVLNGNINDASNTALAGLPNRTAVLDLLTTVTDHLPVVADFTLPSAQIVDRKFYYSGSGFDATGGVTAALDPVKQLLQSGSTAQTTTFTNVSSYSRGLNGVYLSVNDLASSTLTAADFIFRVAPTGASGVVNPSTWNSAPAPLSIISSAGTSTAPATIQLKWADNAIQNTWLQIIVKANANTGLSSPAVFYLGHAQAEVNGIGPYRVTVADLSDVQSAISTSIVGVSDRRDVNKDRRITVADLSYVQQRISTTVNLNNITVPIAGSTEEGASTSNSALPLFDSALSKNSEPDQAEQIHADSTTNEKKYWLRWILTQALQQLNASSALKFTRQP